MRKSSENEIHLRGTWSSVKRRPYFPRKCFPLAPLNLNEIKKEIEAEQNASIYCTSEANENARFTGENSTACEAWENTLKDISNKCEIIEKRSEPNSILEIDKQTNRGEVPSLALKKNPEARGDDSFDLDFSALSLTTPVKKDPVYMTPKVNRLPVCHEAQVSTFDNFVTPKVNTNNFSSKTQVSVQKPSTFVTPMNLLKNNNVKVATPSESDKFSTQKANIESIVCSIPKRLPKDETFDKIVVKNVEYLVLSLLGKGGSSEVFQCYNTGNKNVVAIKCVSLQNLSLASGYINEVKLLQQLQNCNKIIKMYDFEILNDERKLYMVLEKGGDDLSKILKKLATQRAHIPIYMLHFYWMEMLHAVRQIHSRGVIHSDLKPSNFIKADEGLKLIDFGIASSVQNDETSVIKTNPEGSCNYISPEALYNDTSTSLSGPNSDQARYKLHYKSDVWSLGCILYQLVYRRTPFSHLNNLWSKLAYILNPEHKIEYPDADWVPKRSCCIIFSGRPIMAKKNDHKEYEEM
ncbi:hypothetical protein JTB14_024170 [Gonioctena quinquepunctata]|nr:hypothetical protein JTB14_024170 [Gonioctena quinquepunctata]